MNNKNKVLNIFSLFSNILILCLFIIGICYFSYCILGLDYSSIDEEANEFYLSALIGFTKAMYFLGIIICSIFSIIFIIGLILHIKKKPMIYLIVIGGIFANISIIPLMSSIKNPSGASIIISVFILLLGITNLIIQIWRKKIG